jgi:hypothetical protein
MMQIIHLRDTHKEIFYIYCFTQISYKRNFFKHRRQGIIIKDDGTLLIYLFIYLFIYIIFFISVSFVTELKRMNYQLKQLLPFLDANRSLPRPGGLHL